MRKVLTRLQGPKHNEEVGGGWGWIEFRIKFESNFQFLTLTLPKVCGSQAAWRTGDINNQAAVLKQHPLSTSAYLGPGQEVRSFCREAQTRFRTELLWENIKVLQS